MRNDFNLFAVYKSENSKNGISGFKNYIIILVLLIIAILAATGGIKFLTIMTNNQTNSIIDELNSEKYATAKQDFDAAKKSYDSINQYDTILKDSQSTFNDSRFITDDLLNKITSCITQDTTVNDFKIISTDVLLSCTSNNSKSVDIICQALNNTGLFSTVSYSSVTYNTEKSYFEFTINCTFAEVAK